MATRQVREQQEQERLACRGFDLLDLERQLEPAGTATDKLLFSSLLNEGELKLRLARLHEAIRKKALLAAPHRTRMIFGDAAEVVSDARKLFIGGAAFLVVIAGAIVSLVSRV